MEKDNSASAGAFGTPGYNKLKGLLKAYFAWERESDALEQYKKSKELTFNQEIDSPVKLKNEPKVGGAVQDEDRDPNTAAIIKMEQSSCVPHAKAITWEAHVQP